jgi:hypothetical protein
MTARDDDSGKVRRLANLRPGRNATSVEPGQRIALRHGLTATPRPDELEPIVNELADALPWRGADGGVPMAFRRAVHLAAVALWRVQMCEAYLARVGDCDEDGELRPEVDRLAAAAEGAAKHLDRLGMTPAAAAKLGLDLSRGMAAGGEGFEAYVRANYPQSGDGER